jgi:hypothetical protein
MDINGYHKSMIILLESLKNIVISAIDGLLKWCVE